MYGRYNFAMVTEDEILQMELLKNILPEGIN